MEKLYNNIVLPDEWPPRYTHEQLFDEMPIPYLDAPPEVIDITIGRQLFVDNFLIKETNLKFEYHTAKKSEDNPIFKAETSWECDEAPPCAVPKSGGVWYDKDEKLFKMWYEAGWLNKMAYAESQDGIHWERPNLDIVPGTNIILAYENDGSWNKDGGTDDEKKSYFRPDSSAVFIDYDEKNKEKRYKMLMRNPGAEYPAILMTSSDGIHWKNQTLSDTVLDRTTMFYNPFRKKWIYSLRSCIMPEGILTRVREYAENDDFLEGGKWDTVKVNWMAADKNCQKNPYIQFEPQLYNFDAVAYESIMLGMFQIMYGPENQICESRGVPKITELIPTYSRDGFHFTKPSEKAIIQASMTAGSWDRGYVQSVGGVCMVDGDKTRIYYIGFGGDETRLEKEGTKNGMYANGALGMATLRRDGFVSLNSTGTGTLLTKKLTFKNKNKMFVNVDGKLKAEILSADGKVLAVSKEIDENSTCKMLDLADFDINGLSGKPFRIRFTLSGKLYSFWFSEDETGESGGYYGAGKI